MAAGFGDVKKAARRVGLSPRTLREYERRGVDNYHRAVQLARAFDCDVTVYLNPKGCDSSGGSFFRGEQVAPCSNAQQSGGAATASAPAGARRARPVLTLMRGTR
jgi:hypothetical protein